MMTNDDYRLVFTSKEGERVLQDLRERFYDRDTFVRGEPDTTAYNQGARSVLFFIFRQLNDFQPLDEKAKEK
jgi:hypothetical protein|tara:strand:- start:2606 stop:2821 length:216 start_codon:yes stop_codon:yes gene_type:complete